MFDNRFVDIGVLRSLGGEVARAVDREVDDLVAGRFVERGGEVDWPPGDRRAEFLFGKVQRPRRERAVAARRSRHRLLAVVEIILDRLGARVERGVGIGVADQHVGIAEMLEHGRELVLEQGQPMLHPGQPPTLADRLVERVAGGIGAELLAIARAEPLDAVLVEQGLRRGHQRERLCSAGGALVGRVEAPHRLDLVAEEIEPQRAALARREHVDDRPAHRELARVMDRVGAVIAIGDEQPDQRVALDPLALGQSPSQLAHPERGQHALCKRVGRHHQQLRPFEWRLQRMKRRQPLGHHAQCGAGAIVGQAVPRRQAQHLDLGREHRHGVGQRAHRGFVGGNDHRTSALARRKRRARNIGGQPRQEPRRNPCQRQRRSGA